jgi:hypothetical protein
MGTRRTPMERLANLEEKKRHLAEEIATLSAREKVRGRKDDNRRKMLLGSIVLADLGLNAELALYVRTRLPAVMCEADKRLFVTFLGGDRL